VPNSFEGFDGWGEGRGILFIKASVIGKLERYAPGSSVAHLG
jgi:hypothetical protein